MALHDGNETRKNNDTQTGKSSMGAAFATAQDTQHQQTKPVNGAFSFRSMGNLARSAMGRTPASEVLSKLAKALGLVYEEAADKSFEITCIQVDMNQTNTLSVSALVIALRDKANLDLGVAFHTLILEASIEAPAPRFEVVNGVNTEIIRTVGEAYDNVMIQEVSKYVGNTFPQSRQLSAQACVVPRDFNITDTAAVYALASNALFAASSELETSSPNFVDLNLVNADRDSNLTVRTTFGNAQTHNAVSQPVRSDVVIDFSAAPMNQNQNNTQQQGVERVSQVARIYGFMDLVWYPSEQNAQGGAWGQPQITNYQRYAARFVTTALESTNLLTIPAQLLALIPALSLRQNNQWVQAFSQKSFSAERDMHDIGAIGIEVNFEGNASGFGTYIDTKADSFKPEHLHKLVQATFKQGLILSLDVPECGPETWYNDVFAAAAEGNQKANQAVIDAANTLTNGAFSKYFAGNSQIAVDEFNRIHLGHYSDRNGVRKDIRDIDYLAVMNRMGEKDPQIIRDWSDTFLRTNFPLALRLAARKRIINELVTDAVFTGFARRVTFTDAFTDALAKGCQDVGLNIRPVSTYNDLGSYERAGGNFVQSSIMTGSADGLFNRGMGQSNQSFGNNRGFATRNW
jgi:hypothetical protein